MQEDRPSDAPPDTVSIDPEQGFGPHITEAFLDLYGEDSVFVSATVDCLTCRFVGVLVRAGKLSADFEPIQYGSPEMLQALEGFLKVLAARGLENPSTALMRSALGYEGPQTFLATASSVLGGELVVCWLQLLEQEDYAGAAALLAVH